MSKKTTAIPNASDHPRVIEARQKLERLTTRRQEIQNELKRARELGLDGAEPKGLAERREHGQAFEQARARRQEAEARALAEGGGAAVADLPSIDVAGLQRELAAIARVAPDAEQELAEARKAAAEDLGAQLDSRRRELIAAVGSTMDAHLEARRELARFEAEAERAGAKPTRWRYAEPRGQSLTELVESAERWHKERGGTDPHAVGIGRVGAPVTPEFGSGK